VIKCTTLKHWHAIDVHMLVNVMDLVHLYRHCVRHGRPLDECAKWCSCGVLVFQVTFLKAN